MVQLNAEEWVKDQCQKMLVHHPKRIAVSDEMYDALVAHCQDNRDVLGYDLVWYGGGLLLNRIPVVRASDVLVADSGT